MLKKMFLSLALCTVAFSAGATSPEYEACFKAAQTDNEVALCMKAENTRMLKDIRQLKRYVQQLACLPQPLLFALSKSI